MAGLPRFARRLSRVPLALSVLRRHPEGMELSALAAEVDAPEAELREELLAFFTADVGPGAAGVPYRGGHLEFLTADHHDADASTAVVVRLTDEAALTELGVEVFGPDVLAPLLRTAYDLLAIEPDNHALGSAIGTLVEGLVKGVEPVARDGGDVAATLRAAAAGRRRVRISYARAWKPGVVERVIEPYRVISTVRGYEVDAGVVGGGDEARTYLVSGIVSLDVLDETFDRPIDVQDRIAAIRQETAVEFVVSQRSRWAVDVLSETVEVLDEDENDVHLRASLLKPLRDRVGQILVLAGPGAMVVKPDELEDAGREEARRLLSHHGLG